MSTNQLSINISLIGLDPIEASTIKSICSMSDNPNRNRRYKILQDKEILHADIFIISPRTPQNIIKLNRVNNFNPPKPVIYVASDFNKSMAENEYVIDRFYLPSLLLNMLDSIQLNQLQNSGFVIGHSDKIVDTTLRALNADNMNNSIPAKILVVDNNPTVCAQMHLCMKLHNIHCHFANNTNDAVELAKKNSYVLIFLDTNMPGISAYKACKYLKSNPFTSETKIISLSDKTSIMNTLLGLLSGSDKHIIKPAPVEQVESILKEHIPESFAAAS